MRSNDKLVARTIIQNAFGASKGDKDPDALVRFAFSVEKHLYDAGFEIVRKPEPSVAGDCAQNGMATYHVRVGWPEFFSKAVRLPKGSDVATVARAAKDAAADHHGMKHRGQWPAFSWEEDRFLASDEAAPLTFIVGPSQALIERQGSEASYGLALIALREGKGAVDVAEALGRSSPDGREGNIWKLFDDRRRTAQVDAADLRPGRPAGVFDRDVPILGAFWADGIISFAGDAAEMTAFRDMAARVVGVPGSREAA